MFSVELKGRDKSELLITLSLEKNRLLICRRVYGRRKDTLMV